MKNYQDIVDALFTFIIQTKYVHWNCDSAWTHQHLGALYNELNDELDTLAELIIRKDKKAITTPVMLHLSQMSESKIKAELESIDNKLQTLSEIETSVDIQNTLIDMKGITSRIIYLMRKS